MSQAKLQVPIVVGTRPEAIKLVSLILALRESKSYNPIVVSTGQHNRLVEYIFELADIKPDVTLWAGSRRAALNERVASVMQRFEDFCVERFDIDPDVLPTRDDVLAGRHPAMVLVHGDTSSAMAAALSAFHLRIPVMHVEAGLRTGGNNLTPFPEELNRQVISTIAAMHFAPTSENLGNLVRENIPVEQVFVTGNTGIDALQWSSRMNVQFANPELQALCDSDRRVVVVTAHRRENWGDGLRGISEGVARLADSHPEIGFVLPVHPNPRVREVLTERLQGMDNVLLTEPLGYATFARLLGRSCIVITDSGGIQEEAPSLGKPVLVTRETTERTEGLAAGTLRLVGTDPAVIFREADRLLGSAEAYREMSEAENPYGDGRAAERIVACLEHLLLGTDPPTQFGTGYSRAAVSIAVGMRSGREVGVEALRKAVDEAALSEPTTDADEGALEQELAELNEVSAGSASLGEG
ncbi:MAG: UDP-N-acetylglucosamine 2-epimerase (non-hydrolyzing) [Solirubrobacterales bacterium]